VPTDQAWLTTLTYRPIGTDLDLTKFRCNPNIDWWLTAVGMTMHQKRFSFVTCWLAGGELAGYVATAASHVEMLIEDQRTELDVQQQIMPAGTVLKTFPALKIGMLGTCNEYRRKGLGKEMVLYAVGQAMKLSETVGCRFVSVDSDKTEEAIGLYMSCGFKEVQQKKPDRQTVWMYYDLKPRA
jgi:ribosomal protein S18 acetylase RimI-like enzyme